MTTKIVFVPMCAYCVYAGNVPRRARVAHDGSTGYQHMFRASTGERAHTGVLVRTALNDLKRVPEVIEKETRLSKAALNNLILLFVGKMLRNKTGLLVLVTGTTSFLPFHGSL